jgi:hypothetical protein
MLYDEPMTKIEITYDTETGYGSLKAYIGNRTGSWFLGGNLGPEVYALVTSRYGNLDGTGCGWSSPDDEEDAETFAEYERQEHELELPHRLGG